MTLVILCIYMCITNLAAAFALWFTNYRIDYLHDKTQDAFDKVITELNKVIAELNNVIDRR